MKTDFRESTDAQSDSCLSLVAHRLQWRVQRHGTRFGRAGRGRARRADSRGHERRSCSWRHGRGQPRCWRTHLDTRGFDAGRAAQGAEIRAHANVVGAPSWQLVGGDFNTYTCNPLVQDCTTAPAAESVIQDFYGDGWSDGTAGYTGETQLGAGFLPQRLDWILYRGFAVEPGVAFDPGGSDHYALFTDVLF